MHLVFMADPFDLANATVKDTEDIDDDGQPTVDILSLVMVTIA